MSSTFGFTLVSEANHFEVVCRLDDQVIYQGRPGDKSVRVSTEFDDDNIDETHTISIELSGKTHADTTVVEGKIVSDALLHIHTVEIDDFDITNLFYKQSKYFHDFNGTQPAIEDTFDQLMGCNGRVKFEFKSPVYVWLLDNI